MLRMKGLLVIACLAMSPVAVASFGVCSHLTYGEFADREKSLDLMRVAGIGTVRTDFNWEQIQKSDGSWDFSRTDAVVASAKARGITVLPILDYAHGTLCPKPHLDSDTWGGFVRRMAERYGKDCPVFEVWNEENHGKRDLSNPTNYMIVLRRACEEIRSVAPTSKVALGGTAGIPLDYIEELYKLNGRVLFDIMNIHFYSVPKLPEEYFHVELGKLKDLMSRYGDFGKPIWITEIGWPTSEEIPGFNWKDHKWRNAGGVDETHQAIYLARELAIAKAHGIAMFMPYELRAGEWRRYDRESDFGIVHGNFAPKPAFAAYVAGIEMHTTGSTVVRSDIRADGGVCIMKWHRPEGTEWHRERKVVGNTVTMLWRAKGAGVQRIPLNGRTIHFFNVFGKEYFPDVKDGLVELDISESPVYLVSEP